MHRHVKHELLHRYTSSYWKKAKVVYHPSLQCLMSIFISGDITHFSIFTRVQLLEHEVERSVKQSGLLSRGTPKMNLLQSYIFLRHFSLFTIKIRTQMFQLFIITLFYMLTSPQQRCNEKWLKCFTYTNSQLP